MVYMLLDGRDAPLFRGGLLLIFEDHDDAVEVLDEEAVKESRVVEIAPATVVHRLRERSDMEAVAYVPAGGEAGLMSLDDLLALD